MIPVLIKTVLCSVFVGLSCAVCRSLAIHSGLAQTAGLGLALAGSLATALLIPIAGGQSANSGIVPPANAMTLLQELQAMLQARSGSSLLPRPFEAPVPTTNSPEPERSSRRVPGPASEPGAQEPGPPGTEPSSGQAELPASIVKSACWN